MINKLLIVSTCTNGKKHRVHEDCHLRCLSGEEVQSSIRNWLMGVSGSSLHRYPVDKLYKGLHWKLTTRALQAAIKEGFESELWILSAGYGLVSSSHKLAPYSATFSSGDDSIHNLAWPDEFTSFERTRAWWKKLNETRSEIIPEYVNDPESLVDLFEGHGDEQTLLLLIVSKDYFPAIEMDLKELSAKTGNIVVLGAGVYREVSSPQLKHLFAPLSEKFKKLSNGLDVANVALNAAAAHWLISNHSTVIRDGVERVIELFDRYDKTIEADVRPVPVKMTDSEVLKYIANNYHCKSSATQLLRLLRDVENKSCEQKRFGGLFKQFTQSQEKGLFDE